MVCLLYLCILQFVITVKYCAVPVYYKLLYTNAPSAM